MFKKRSVLTYVSVYIYIYCNTNKKKLGFSPSRDITFHFSKCREVYDKGLTFIKHDLGPGCKRVLSPRPSKLVLIQY